MKKVGEHVTIDFLGVKKEYSPEFYNKVIYKIAKKAKIEVLNISEKVCKPPGYTGLALLAELKTTSSYSRLVAQPEDRDRFSGPYLILSR